MPDPGWRALRPQILLLAMIAIWGCSYSSVKTCLDAHVPPFVLLAARFWLAVVCLLPFAARDRTALRATRRTGIATGCALLTGYALQTIGMNETTASMGGFLSGLIVLLVALGAWLVFGERLRAATIVGLLLGCGGIVLLCLGGDDAPANGRTSTLRGIALQICSSTSYAAHVLMISRFGRRGTELQFCLWQLMVVAAGALILLPLGGGPGPVEDYASSSLVLGNVLYLGVLATALGIAVQSRVQPQIRPGLVAVLFATQPVFAAIFGWALLGDRLGPLEFAGGAAITAGVVIASRPARPSRPAPAPAPPPAAAT